jgi:hypothetical protein
MSKLYYNTVSADLRSVIETVSDSLYFKDFYLCGGTALALQIGHRISVDADFICEKDFEKDNLIKYVLVLFPQVTDIHSNNFGVFCRVNNIKLDFLSWNLSFINSPIILDDVRMVSVEDIIAMKIFAILRRGEKKDYFDIATVLSKYSLHQIIGFYKTRHKSDDEALVLRFLASYSDIRVQPDPLMLNGLNWEACERILSKHLKDYVL